jgi:hypothetical protein
LWPNRTLIDDWLAYVRTEQDEDDVVEKKLKRTVSIPTSGATVDIFSLLRVKSDAVTVPL